MHRPARHAGRSADRRSGGCRRTCSTPSRRSTRPIPYAGRSAAPRSAAAGLLPCGKFSRSPSAAPASRHRSPRHRIPRLSPPRSVVVVSGPACRARCAPPPHRVRAAPCRRQAARRARRGRTSRATTRGGPRRLTRRANRPARRRHPRLVDGTGSGHPARPPHPTGIPMGIIPRIRRRCDRTA